MSARLVVYTTVLTTLIAISASRADKLYVTEKSLVASRILRMNLDGSMQEELFGSLSPRFASGIAVDSFHGKLYLAVELSGFFGIYRANLDGSNLELVVPMDRAPPPGGEPPVPLDVDWRDQKLYWIEFFGPIYRVDVWGGVPEVVQHAGDARQVAVDSDREQLYWIDVDEFTISRADVAGGAIEVVVEDNEVIPSLGLELDLVRRNLYWVTANGRIGTASMDGGEVQTVPGVSGFPLDVAVDARRGHLYWSLPLSGKIVRANLDGTGKTVIASDLSDDGFAWEIALHLECGNSRIDPGETCDVAIEPGWTGECVTECFDSDPCSSDEVTGLGSCSARCEFEAITEPIDRDGCCPNDSFTLVDDSDCTLRPFPDVPAVSSWGAVLSSLLLAVGITLKWRRRQAATPHAR